MYPTEFVPDPDQLKPAPPGYGQALKDVALTAADLARRELSVLRAELAESACKIKEHTFEVAAFGALLVLSIFPFLAFLVVGLGELLEHRYWLSSLIVAVVCAAVGGFFALRAYGKIRVGDLNFSRTRDSMENTMRALRRQFEKVKTTATKEATHGPAHNF